ncbi:nuclear transport factor 2 family protein [Cyclobacterium qasimii]|uniref:SnoaL-like domain-containing protein n=2 Tax=Cyclobacterium qasimii TaxID=1350429 RepID=A0A512CJ54_9BACT|nr:nuclear transport factor 2 family protein [Cyclobacterium qasimii]GEO24215.1 hypothetical protein CQA01_47490 [Cyclobacterium qasimii]
MKKLIFSILIVTLLLGCNSDKTEKEQTRSQNFNLTPLEVVNNRMDLYNQHNFSEFIKLYANDVEIYTYPDKLLGIGTDNIISIFEPKFATKSIKVEIVSQMNNGNYVINHEIVTEKGIETKYISIYKVKDGLIKSVKFVRDK